MPEYEMKLGFAAADDGQAGRLVQAWAGTMAGEFGTRLLDWGPVGDDPQRLEAPMADVLAMYAEWKQQALDAIGERLKAGEAGASPWQHLTYEGGLRAAGRAVAALEFPGHDHNGIDLTADGSPG